MDSHVCARSCTRKPWDHAEGPKPACRAHISFLQVKALSGPCSEGQAGKVTDAGIADHRAAPPTGSHSGTWLPTRLQMDPRRLSSCHGLLLPRRRNCRGAAARFLGLNVTHSHFAEAAVGCPGPAAGISMMVFVQKATGRGRGKRPPLAAGPARPGLGRLPPSVMGAGHYSEGAERSRTREGVSDFRRQGPLQSASGRPPPLLWVVLPHACRRM